MNGKEKLMQIYEEMADITLQHLNIVKEKKIIMGNEELDMVFATLQFYSSIYDDCHPSSLFH